MLMASPAGAKPRPPAEPGAAGAFPAGVIGPILALMTATLPRRFNLARHCLAENARLRPSKTALVIVGEGLGEERWTYADVDRTVRGLAAGLRGLGLPAGARIMIRMGNEADFAFAYFAAIAAGFVALPSSSQLTAAEAAWIAEDAGAAALLVGAGRDDPTLRQAARRLGAAVLDPGDLRRLKETPTAEGYADTLAEDPAHLVYTSGTSGRPKGVLHAQRVALGRRPMHDHWMGLAESDILLHAGALNWTYTLGVGLLDPWARGAATILYNGPRDPGLWPALIARHRATIFAATPGLYRQMLKHADLAAHDLSSLRHGLAAGEALPAELLESWLAATGIPIYEALGMSEISTYISSGPGTPVRPGSPGRPQPGRRVAILDRDAGETPLPAGRVGLLAVHRSDPGLMLGYWNRPDEDAQAFRGEWFAGGDLASFDEDGYVHYHGRNDDVMNALGYRVSPLEIETVLLGHPSVAEAAVTEVRVRQDGVPVIAAFVVLRDGVAGDPDGIQAFAAERLAAYKRPRRIFVLQQLPRTPHGKLSRRALRDLVPDEAP
jgi:acyl-coenzyme A synthetase/AMP-(fatty) acid ligase